MNNKPFKIRAATRKLYNEEPETVIPRLLGELGAPHKVAAVLSVSPNAVRVWLMHRDWAFDGVEWVLKQEPEHA